MLLNQFQTSFITIALQYVLFFHKFFQECYEHIQSYIYTFINIHDCYIYSCIYMIVYICVYVYICMIVLYIYMTVRLYKHSHTHTHIHKPHWMLISVVLNTHINLEKIEIIQIILFPLYEFSILFHLCEWFYDPFSRTMGLEK